MPRISIWWKLAAVGLVCYLSTALFFSADVRGQKDDKDKDKEKDKDDKKVDKKKDGPTRTYYGIEGCRTGGPGGIGCHNQAVTAARPEESVCRQHEIKYWLANDKHSTAFRVLIADETDAKAYAALDLARYSKADKTALKLPSEEDMAKEIVKNNTRAIQMQQILADTERGKKIAEQQEDKKYKLIRDPDCLACHAQVIPKQVDDRPKTKEEREDKEKEKKRTVRGSFHEEEGVNCVVCHGPYADWVNAHAGVLGGVDEWRGYTREAKETEWGLRDLWNPAKRTKLCASCHVGHQGDGKDIPRRFVTHEMYAAGHPPLPGFEIATFSNEMPRHWEYIRDKDPDVLKKQKIDQKQFKVEQTQLVLIGAATSLGEQMRLVAGQSDEAVKNDHMLDESNFDCYACHHGLTSDAWRQKRGYGNRRPGRLPMRPWATELIKLAVLYAEPNKEAREKRIEDYEKKLDAVKSAFTVRMYGDPKKISQTAKALGDWADKLASDLITKAEKTPASEKDAKELYETITTLFHTGDQKKWVDYDSARQVGWGFKVMYFETQNLDWASMKQRDKDGKEKEPSADVKEALGQIDKLDVKLKLRLPTKPKSIDDDLDETMKRLNDYKPKEFNDLLEGLGKSLKK